MQIKNLAVDEEGVSPVIGVVLMVAITVILAAVIATFVLGIGDQVTQSSPQTGFSFDYNGTHLTIIHDGGENIDAGTLYVKGGGYSGNWSDIGSYGDGSVISAGNTLTVGVSSSDTIRVVWEPAESSDSATLAKWEGPDA